MKAPPSGWLAWNKNLVAVTDRGGYRAMEAVNQVNEQEVSAALLPTMAPDAVFCTDGHATYKKIAKTTRIAHFALNGVKQSRRRPKTHHINTANALISRYRDFIRPFCGPASQNLKAYRRWHAARENGDRDYHSVFKALLDTPRATNTLCGHSLFDCESIGLGSDAALPAGYMAGHAFGRKYNAESKNSNKFFEGFQFMLSAYEQLISLGGITQ